MSSEELKLRQEIIGVIDDVESKLTLARKIVSFESDGSDPLTQPELVALKQHLLDAYQTSATSMSHIKRLNAASNAHKSSLKSQVAA